HKGAVQAVAFSPDGKQAASAARDKTLVVWDLTTGKLSRRLEVPEAGTKLLFTDDGRYLICGHNKPLVLVFDTKPGEEVRRLEWPEGGSFGQNLGASLSCSPDGRYLVVGNG